MQILKIINVNDKSRIQSRNVKDRTQDRFEETLNELRD